MIRHTLPAYLLLSLLALQTRAADTPPCTVTALATRAGDKITLSIQLSRKQKQNVPTLGPTDVTTVKSAPKIILLTGQSAQLVVGDSSKPNSPPDSITSGYKIDVISVKNKDSLLMITTLIENTSVIWADVSTIPITSTNPAETSK